jgi:hypothetical protein
MAKIVCVLYEDPVAGYPKVYARDDIPDIERYPGRQTTPTPKAIDFTQGNCSEACPAGSACVDFSSRWATRLSSPPIRTDRTASSSGNCPALTLSSHSRSGPPI